MNKIHTGRNPETIFQELALFSQDQDELGKSNESQELINQPKVLMYHRLVEDKALSQQERNCLHIEEFHKQLEIIHQLGYTPITFNDYRLFLRHELQLPKKPLILTFDDGYLDTYRLAFPLLQQYGMKAVIFVLGDRSLKSNIWDAETPGISHAPLMNDEHIVELHKNGFEIGTHTLSHSNLEKISKEDCYKEIYQSKIILEALLGARVISFSYPYGSVNQQIKEPISGAGYSFACSVYSGPPKFGKDHLEIRRIGIYNNISLLGFAMRLAVPYEYVEWMWWRARNGKAQSFYLSNNW